MNSDISNQLENLLRELDFFPIQVLDQPHEQVSKVRQLKTKEELQFALDRHNALKWAMQNPNFEFKGIYPASEYSNEFILKYLRYLYNVWTMYFEQVHDPEKVTD